jgi:hypothetical protein
MTKRLKNSTYAPTLGNLLCNLLVTEQAIKCSNRTQFHLIKQVKILMKLGGG